jgi:hypothetical protein
MNITIEGSHSNQMTVEDNYQSIEQPIPRRNNKGKYVVSGLLVITILLNLSVYNMWLIPEYNIEVKCILDNNPNCVNESFPCSMPYFNGFYDNGMVTFHDMNDLDISEFNATWIMGLSMASLFFLGFVAFILLWNKIEYGKNYIHISVSFIIITILLVLDVVIYRAAGVLAEKVLLYQEHGCYTLADADLFSYIITYNDLNMLCAGLGVILMLVCICWIRSIYKDDS